jgi:hypothetical protein
MKSHSTNAHSPSCSDVMTVGTAEDPSRQRAWSSTVNDDNYDEDPKTQRSKNTLNVDHVKSMAGSLLLGSTPTKNASLKTLPLMH